MRVTPEINTHYIRFSIRFFVKVTLNLKDIVMATTITIFPKNIVMATTITIFPKFWDHDLPGGIPLPLLLTNKAKEKRGQKCFHFSLKLPPGAQEIISQLLKLER